MKLVVCAIVAALAAACAPPTGREPAAAGSSPSGASVTPTTAATASADRPAPTTAPSVEAPRFIGSISRIDAATRTRMRYSWRSGCPVAIDDLRLLRLSFIGFDGRARTGELIVHEDEARAVLDVFQRLFRARFPIRRMRLVDEYAGDDARSMAANNTSGFNCRPSAGDPSRWSEHSYGRAIDINPVQNPYVSGGRVEPAAGASYLDRSRSAPGLIRRGDVVVRAFASIGWTWGGTWTNSKDYQHFSRSGR